MVNLGEVTPLVVGRGREVMRRETQHPAVTTTTTTVGKVAVTIRMIKWTGAGTQTVRMHIAEAPEIHGITTKTVTQVTTYRRDTGTTTMNSRGTTATISGTGVGAGLPLGTTVAVMNGATWLDTRDTATATKILNY